MEDIEHHVAKAAAGLLAVQQIQQGYDEVGWRMSSPEFRKMRHIVLHLSKVVGTLANLVEHFEHDAFEKGQGEGGVALQAGAADVKSAVGNMVYHAAQLASLMEMELPDCFFEKISSNASRFAPDSVFPALAAQARQR